MTDYRLISSDSHVTMPDEAWQEYLSPEFRDRALRRVDRDRGHPEQAVGRVRRVVGQPAVVAAHAVEVQCGVGGLQRSADVEHFGIDAVEVHVLDALDRIAGTGAPVLELADVEGELLGLLPRQVVEGHDRRALALEHAHVAVVGLLDARRPVAELGRQVLLPRLVGHGHVRVGRDEPVVGHAACSFCVVLTRRGRGCRWGPDAPAR
jgi:hypothetical protein